jgi:hypothetical protein
LLKLKKAADGVEIETNFSVNANDFDIEIPSVKIKYQIKLILRMYLR